LANGSRIKGEGALDDVFSNPDLKGKTERLPPHARFCNFLGLKKACSPKGPLKYGYLAQKKIREDNSTTDLTGNRGRKSSSIEALFEEGRRGILGNKKERGRIRTLRKERRT